MGMPRFGLPSPKEMRRKLLGLGKAFPEERIPGYVEYEPRVRRAVHTLQAPNRLFRETRRNLRLLGKELKRSSRR